MDILTNIFGTENYGILDQTTLPPDKLESIITRGLGNSVRNLEKVIENETRRRNMIRNIPLATDKVLEILQRIGSRNSQFVFSGNSTNISFRLLSKRLEATGKYPDVSHSLQRSKHLNSDQNLAFRSNHSFPGIRSDAIVIDEFTEHMIKTRQITAGFQNRKKVVVLAVFEEDKMWDLAREDFEAHQGKSFFYGIRDNETAEFLSDWALVESTVVDVNEGFRVLKDSAHKNVRWKKSKLSPPQNAILAKAEQVNLQWKSLLDYELASKD